MRIISGIYGRRRFDVPSTFSARPTTDFAKENIFNVISNHIDFEGVDDSLTLIRGDVFRDLHSAPTQGFDFIFADPPYALKELPEVPELVFKRDLLRDGGIFVMEHPKTNDFSGLPYFYQHRVYGSVNFSIFIKEEEKTDA